MGHSNRSLEDFLGLLQGQGIRALADVRAFPSSRKYPHFGRGPLARALEGVGIVYRWLGDSLGGYRREGLGRASPNTAWVSVGFRNYADHMLTPEFRRGMERLLWMGKRWRTAFMCAERFWWRCHRRFIADWLVAHGHRVIHILDPGKLMDHRLPPFAEVRGDHVVYPDQGELA